MSEFITYMGRQFAIMFISLIFLYPIVLITILTLWFGFGKLMPDWLFIGMGLSTYLTMNWIFK